MRKDGKKQEDIKAYLLLTGGGWVRHGSFTKLGALQISAHAAAPQVRGSHV